MCWSTAARGLHIERASFPECHSWSPSSGVFEQLYPLFVLASIRLRNVSLAAGRRRELGSITADFQRCSLAVIAVGRQLAAKQAELETLGCEEVAAELAQLQADEKEKLRCELTLQARRGSTPRNRAPCEDHVRA